MLKNITLFILLVFLLTSCGNPSVNEASPQELEARLKLILSKLDPVIRERLEKARVKKQAADAVYDKVKSNMKTLFSYYSEVDKLAEVRTAEQRLENVLKKARNESEMERRVLEFEAGVQKHVDFVDLLAKTLQAYLELEDIYTCAWIKSLRCSGDDSRVAINMAKDEKEAAERAKSKLATAIKNHRHHENSKELQEVTAKSMDTVQAYLTEIERKCLIH